MGQQFKRRTLLDHFPVVHQHQMIGQPQRLINIVGHEDDRPAKDAVNAGHLGLQCPARNRIERAKGLIHQQYLRVRRQRARHSHTLLLST